jgi:hypothetical protein
MTILLKLFWEILLKRKGPQDVPFSRSLCHFVVVLHLLVGMLLISLTNSVLDSILFSVMSTLMLVAFIHIMLITHRQDGRWVQTLTAMAGVEVVLGFISIPVIVILLNEVITSIITLVLSLLILGWNGVVAAHIFGQALDNNKGLGVAYAIFYLFIAIIIGDALS